MDGTHSWFELRMPALIRFGPGALQTLASEHAVAAASRIGMISDKGVEAAGIVACAEELLRHAGTETITRYTALSGEPTFDLLREVIVVMREAKCDLIVGIGGGSAMDMAKATAALLDKGDTEPYLAGSKMPDSRTVPCILLPTTAGTGSEVTSIAVFGDEAKGVKRGIVGAGLLADAAVVDPLLTLSCPPRVSAASGLDALTHAVEAYLAVRATPWTNLYAEQAMRLFPGHIAKAVHSGGDRESRIAMSTVSLYAGIALGNAGVGAIHALAYPLGGTFHVEHGVANALLMPHVLRMTGVSEPDKIARIAGFLQLGDYTARPREALEPVVEYTNRLLGMLDLPVTLRELGVEEAALPKLAREAAGIDRLLLNTSYKLTENKIESIYRSAFDGLA
jgi:alcohol dehydrogenase class IV